MLTSAWRAARHRERERIKSDVGLAEEGKRIGRPTISRRLRERVAERIAAGETPSRVAKDIVLRRPSLFLYATSQLARSMLLAQALQNI
jgi:hypothetical protein